MDVKVRDVLPLFVTVMVWGALVAPTACTPKLKVRVESCTAGPMAVAVRRLVVRPALELVATVKVPLRAPLLAGVKVTVMSHAAPALSVAGQALCALKSPVAAMAPT